LNSKVFFFFMTTNILLIFFTYFFLPETKNVPLEQMDSLFGDVNHVEKGAGLVDDGPTHASLEDDKKAESATIEMVSRKPESV